MKRIDALGASITLDLVEPQERIEKAVGELLNTPSCRERAADVARENAAQKRPSEIVAIREGLVADAR
jgi:hypothetical protein